MADFSRLPGPNADLWDWQLLAACRGVDSSLFFHPEGERGAARSARENSAKEVCMRCPVRAECAAHALAVREPYGVWGGLTEDEREELMGRARNRLVSASGAKRTRHRLEHLKERFSEEVRRRTPDSPRAAVGRRPSPGGGRRQLLQRRGDRRHLREVRQGERDDLPPHGGLQAHGAYAARPQ